jgi:acetyl esterase/lipase
MRKTVLMVIMAAMAFGATAAVKVSLDVTGQLLACEGAKVANIKVDRDEHRLIELSFDFAPTETGPATITVAGLTPQNWILHEGPLQLGKYTFEEFAKGVKIDEPVAARLAVNKKGGPQKTKDWAVWQQRLVWIKSSLDGTDQPCYFWAPEKATTEAVPLIVGLHTWSADYLQLSHYKGVHAYAEKSGWAFVGPNFRGPNSTPQGCGSDYAVQDIVDAVNYAKARVKVDASRVYIIGGSGGGHMTLLMCGRHPEVFAGGAAFCPITDCARWYHESLEDHPGRGKGYAKMLVSACGGTPAEKPEEYKHRSPLTFLPAAREAGVPIYIVTGIHDGWQGSVPVGQSFRAFNVLADEKDRVSEADIDFIEKNQAVPEALKYTGENDPFYHEKIRIHFRRTSANVRFTLFEGGHGGNFPAGFDFLSRQRKGQPADFTLPATGKGSEEQLRR